MEEQDREGLSPALDQLVNDARSRAVAEIRARIQRFLLEPDSSELMTLVTCDLGLLLDEVSRLQSIRQRQERELARLKEELQAATPPVPAAAASAEPVHEPAMEPAPRQELATLKTASESLQAALARGDWIACHAALDTLRAGLGLEAKKEAGEGSGQPAVEGVSK